MQKKKDLSLAVANKLFRQEKEKYEKWENSVEGVVYNLGTWGDVTTNAERDKILIAETLLKVPKKIKEKVLDKVIFVILDSIAYGTVQQAVFTKSCDEKDIKKIGGKFHMSVKQSLIFLNFNAMVKKSKFFKMQVIAHEIAHFILGHHTPEKQDGKAERKADDLIEKWGFKRAYKDYNGFEITR